MRLRVPLESKKKPRESGPPAWNKAPITAAARRVESVREEAALEERERARENPLVLAKTLGEAIFRATEQVHAKLVALGQAM